MTWELQRHYHPAIAPSVYHAAQEEPDPRAYLEQLRKDQLFELHDCDHDAYKTTFEHHSDRALCHDIASYAIAVKSTTNGGHEVYLDAGLHNRVEWCTEDQRLDWYLSRFDANEDHEAAAARLARHLNRVEIEDDWYHHALDVVGAEQFFDEQRTQEADPSARSDVFILTDGDETVEVRHDEQSDEWKVLGDLN